MPNWGSSVQEVALGGAKAGRQCQVAQRTTCQSSNNLRAAGSTLDTQNGCAAESIVIPAQLLYSLTHTSLQDKVQTSCHGIYQLG